MEEHGFLLELSEHLQIEGAIPNFANNRIAARLLETQMDTGRTVTPIQVSISRTHNPPSPILPPDLTHSLLTSLKGRTC